MTWNKLLWAAVVIFAIFILRDPVAAAHAVSQVWHQFWVFIGHL